MPSVKDFDDGQRRCCLPASCCCKEGSKRLRPWVREATSFVTAGARSAAKMKKYKKMPSVGSVMTPFPYFVDADATVLEVERLMREHRIRHVPVEENGRVAGIVSERDLRHLTTGPSPQADKAQIRAREVMTTDPYVAAFDTPLNAVAAEMAKRRIGSAIIVHHQKLAGILSVTDVCRILSEILTSEFSRSTRGSVA
jgi:acetoin utilization protein AcuB